MEDAGEFLQELYGELKEGEFIEIRSIAAGRTPNRMFMKSVDAAVTAAAGLAQNSNVFYGVATRDGRGGKKENIVSIPAVWVDLDNNEGYPLLSERLLRVEDFPTSAVIASGSGLHLYWFLDHFVGPDQIPLIEKINKTMAMRIGGDTAYDAARCLRVPGTLNHKYRPEPREVRVSSFHPEYRFTTEHLCAYLEIGAGGQGSGVRGEVTSKGHDRPGHAVQVAGSPDILSCASPSSGPSGSVPLPCRHMIWRGVAEGGRNNACFQLALDLKRQSIPLGPAVELLNRWNVSNLPPMEPSQIVSAVEGVYKGDYTGLGCDKSPMKDFCSGDCALKRKGRVISAPEPSTVPVPSLISFDDYLDMEVPEAEFVVEGLVPKNGVTLLTGEGGIGKSFLSIDLACSVANGVPFLGEFACEQGPVLVIDLENHNHQISRRLRRITAARSDYVRGTPVHYIDKRNKRSAKLLVDQERGASWLEALVERMEPRLVVIDPLVAAHSRDENDNVAMREVFARLQDIAEEYDLAFLVLHHPRKRGMVNDAGQMIRGASDLRNAVDSHLFFRKISKERILVEHDKCRQAPEVDKFIIEMTQTPDGDGVTFRFAGESNEGQEKSAEARECVLSMLKAAGECRRKELVGAAQAEGVSLRTLVRAIDGLLEDGDITKVAHGVYALTGQQTDLDV